MNRRTKRRRGERGLTLIEVLVSFFILFVVTLAVLQLLSMAYLVNLGAMVRTDLTYRAEQVVEQIRLERYRVNFLFQAPNDACIPVGQVATMTLAPGDTTCAPVWGPNGANIFDGTGRYTLSYTIANTSVTVRAEPVTSGPNRYLGPAATKVVVYVAQLP